MDPLEMAEAVNALFMITKDIVDTMVEYIDVALKIINSEVKTALISWQSTMDAA